MTQRQLTFSDYQTMFRRHWVLIVVLSLLGAPLGYGISRLLTSRYTSTTTVLVEPPTISPDIIKPAVNGQLTQQLASMNAQILSRSSLDPIIHEFNLYPKDVNRVPPDELVQRLRDSIEVSALKEMEETKAQGLPGFTISVTLDNPITARDVCSRLTTLFIQDASNYREQTSKQTTDFLDGQLTEAKRKLDEQSQKVADFKLRYFGSLPEDQAANATQLASLDAQLNAVTQALAGAQQDLNFHQTLLEQQRAAWQSSQTGDSPQTLEIQMAKLQSDLANLRSSGYTDEFPTVIEKKNQIAELKTRIADSATKFKSAGAPKPVSDPPQVQQLEAQVNADRKMIAEKTADHDRITKQIHECEARMRLSPAVQQQYEELTRDGATANQSYQTLLKEKNDSAMNTALEKQQGDEIFETLDAANLPETPSFPNRPLFAGGGFLLGLSIGLGLAYFVEIQDTSMRSERDIETILRLPVLAMIPPVEAIEGRKSRRGLRALTAGGSSGARA